MFEQLALVLEQVKAGRNFRVFIGRTASRLVATSWNVGLWLRHRLSLVPLRRLALRRTGASVLRLRSLVVSSEAVGLAGRADERKRFARGSTTTCDTRSVAHCE